MRGVSGKRMLCVSMLDGSLTIPQDYHELIIETMERIPVKNLERISRSLDRFILIAKGTSRAVEHFLWQCMAKHKMRTVPPMFKRGKPLRLPEPIAYDTFAIILIEHELKKMLREEKMYVIAHELAHVFLNHRVRGSRAVTDLTTEEKADEQVRKWGFKVFQESSSAY